MCQLPLHSLKLCASLVPRLSLLSRNNLTRLKERSKVVGGIIAEKEGEPGNKAKYVHVFPTPSTTTSNS